MCNHTHKRPIALFTSHGRAVATVAFLLAAVPAYSAEGHFWASARQNYPLCISWIDQHEQLTDQLGAVSKGLAHTTTRQQRSAIEAELNRLAQQRSEAMAGLQDCIKDNYGYHRTFKLDAEHTQVGMTRLTGTTIYQNEPFSISLGAGHFIGDNVKAEVTNSPAYTTAWGKMTSEGVFHVTRLRELNGHILSVNFDVNVRPPQP